MMHKKVGCEKNKIPFDSIHVMKSGFVEYEVEKRDITRKQKSN